MELFYLRGSPWSLRIMWCLMSINDDIFKDIKTSGSGKTVKLAPRVKVAKLHNDEDKNYETVTLPMFFYKNENDEECVIRHGFEIIEYFCEKHKETSEFAATFLENIEEMKEWNDKSDTVGRYFRSIFAKIGYEISYYFAPTFLTYIPFVLTYIGKSAMKGLGEKYGEEDKKFTLEMAEDILQEMNDILENNEVLVGESFTYADISMYTMIEATYPTKGEVALTFGALTPLGRADAKSKKWDEKFPAVFEAKKQIFETYFTEDIIKKTHVFLKQPLKADA